MEQAKNDRISELFNQARNEKPKISFESTKNQFLSSVVQKGVKNSPKMDVNGFSLIKSILISLSVISIVTVATIFLVDNQEELLEANNIKEIVEVKFVGSEEKDLIINEEIEKFTSLESEFKFKGGKNKQLINNNRYEQIQFPLDSKQQKEILIKEDTSYRFPVLTQQQIESNNKQKLIMLKYLARYKRMPAHNNIDQRKYPMIYWNELVKNGKKTSIDATNAFHIQNTEVSVLEYRTFLYDLLIQGRKADFLIAKPDQEQWVKEFKADFNQPMVDNYFSHPAYNDYPINNISRKGAEMYCEWLTEERNQLNPEKYGYLASKIRLPTDKEWIQAASCGGKRLLFPWRGSKVQNSKGCFLANHKPGIVDESLECIQNFKNIYLNKEDQFDSVKTKDDVIIRKGFLNPYSADGGLYTVKVTSYNPNAFNLFCMSGNVAEMVVYEDGSIGAKGGSWTSTPAEIQIDAIDKYKGISTPNVNIGFRPVITYLSTSKDEVNDCGGDYMFPILKYKEIQENKKQKDKMFGKIKKQKNKKKSKASVEKNKKEEWFQTDPIGFLFIPTGNIKIKEKELSVQAFYMKETEVTNLEYRTFLFDLLIQNRKDEFLIAKPDQLVWNKAIGDSNNVSMVDNYFSNTDYNNYPALGMSRAGAEMYCKWLNEQLLLRIPGVVVNDFRLPTEIEWMYAASNGGKNIPYPWGGPYIRNSKGTFLANFYPMKDDYDTDGHILTGEVKSYNPNDFGLYDMSGNVAEMINYTDGTVGTKGGSFTSVEQELQIVEGKDRFKGVSNPNVNVGFRPVMTYLKREKE